MGEDVPVYWDPDEGKLYWLDGPTRRYIDSYIR
jgi:hypothetical protein